MSEYLKNLSLFDWVGIVGSLLICAAYWAVANRVLSAESRQYHLANFAGAVMLLVSLYFRPNPGAILIELIWATIAGVALIRGMRGEKQGNNAGA